MPAFLAHSQMGQSLHFCDVRVVSAFHPIATKSRTSRQFGVRAIKRQSAPQQKDELFDHLIGGREELIRNGEAERLGGFEINR